MVHLPDIDLIKLVKEGDETAFEQLLYRYNPLIKRLVGSYYARNYDKEDFYQIGVLAFYHAVLTFKMENDGRFYAFALSCVRNKIISAWRQIREEIQYETDYHDFLVVMDSTPSYDFGSEIIDIVNDDQLLNQRQRLDDLLNNQKFFSKMEQKVLSGYIAGMSYQEIANAKGLKVKQVNQALTRIRAKTKQLGIEN